MFYVNSGPYEINGCSRIFCKLSFKIFSLHFFDQAKPLKYGGLPFLIKNNSIHTFSISLNFWFKEKGYLSVKYVEIL